MKIYNTLTRTKERFIPLEEGKVKMYVCGPTVYDYIHLGNARPLVCFDIFRRYLEHKGYEVRFVQNFTDIDDKLIRRALEEGTTVPEIAERFIAAYQEDSKNLGVKPPSIAPRATASMDAIRNMIQELLNRGFAYKGSDAIYYDVSRNPRYGRLSGYSLESLRSGERRQAYSAEGKEAAEDFALWKFKREGEPSWEGPGGEGRPGWHIECSAMIRDCLGETIDIHAGGQDLIFPHHENEIAQSEVLHEAPLANYWMHNAHINIDGVKLSKSLGNSVKLRDLAEVWTYPVLRFFIAQANYRSMLNVDEAGLQAAGNALERIRNVVADLRFRIKRTNTGEPEAAAASSVEIREAEAAVRARERAVYAAMDDDLNTAEALSEIFVLIHEYRCKEEEASYRSRTVLEAILKLILEFFSILGIDLSQKNELPPEMQILLEERAAARARKDWAKSDELRVAARAMGYEVRDTAEGQQCTALTD